MDPRSACDLGTSLTMQKKGIVTMPGDYYEL
jgi:hypothetical protein